MSFLVEFILALTGGFAVTCSILCFAAYLTRD